jgi:hypothetical protein
MPHRLFTLLMQLDAEAPIAPRTLLKAALMFAESGGTTSSEFIIFPHSPTPTHEPPLHVAAKLGGLLGARWVIVCSNASTGLPPPLVASPPMSP